jgi:shikimate dehydrogenase
VIPHLDELSEDARALGAVNTVLFKDGKRIGHNTDWSGFAEPFRRKMADVARDRVVQIGAGGAGSAVAHAAMVLGVKQLTIIDIDPARAQRVADNLGRHFGPGRARAGLDVAAAVAEADGIINATPIGMDGHPGMPLPAQLLRAELWVAEVIYFPLETELLRRARALGVPHHRRRRHGGVPGGRCLPAVYRARTGQRQDDRPFHVDGILNDKKS